MDKGLSQNELAKKVGVSNQLISFYERGKRNPKIETWQKLADFFDVSIPYLQGLSNIRNLDTFLDDEKFIKAISVPSNDSNFVQVPINELFAKSNANDLKKLKSIVDVLSYDSGGSKGDKINKLYSMLSTDDMAGIGDLILQLTSFLKMGLEAITGDKKSQEFYEKIGKIISKYEGWDKWDDEY